MSITLLPTPLQRSLYFSEQVDQTSIKNLKEKIININDNDKYLKKLYKIHELDYKPKPIKIYIDSYGGQVYQCLGLVAVMNDSKTPIHTYVTGCAMSCGFVILIHGHKRFAYEHATPLYHQVSSGSVGKVKDMEEKLVESKRLQGKLEELTLAKTKISRKQLKAIYKKKIDWYMDAAEAKKLGVVDEII